MTPLLALARRLEQGAVDDLHPCNVDRRAAAQVIREAADFQRELGAARARIEELTAAGLREDHEVCQILGKALGYPLPPEGGDEVVTADHVAVTIAQEAAARIAELEAALRDTWAAAEDAYEAIQAGGKASILDEVMDQHRDTIERAYEALGDG